MKYCLQTSLGIVYNDFRVCEGFVANIYQICDKISMQNFHIQAVMCNTLALSVGKKEDEQRKYYRITKN